MGELTRQIQELSQTYASISNDCMRDLCMTAKVDYREPSESKRLMEDLQARGLVIRVAKYNRPDKEVGQYLILRSLDGDFVAGYEVKISFVDYTVHSKIIYEEGDIVITEGIKH
jgi:hypothetical protein